MQPEPQARQTYDFIIYDQLLTYGVMFQVTPAELIDIEFIKPKHIKNHEQQDNASALQAKRMKVTGGPAEH